LVGTRSAADTSDSRYNDPGMYESKNCGNLTPSPIGPRPRSKCRTKGWFLLKLDITWKLLATMFAIVSHKTKLIRDWFAKRPHWRMHFTPTSPSWINQVERFFALLTERQIRRGVHRSTEELEAAIRAYIDATNAEPKPFRWTKSADDIRVTINRFCKRTIDEHHSAMLKTSD
jgi:hypothetical protein